jgi:tRNA nucleotidyltransferase/poly(A) polymerase
MVAQLAKAKGISEPYIVGGLPRDKLLGRIENIDDIDITTGDDSAKELSKLVYTHARNTFPDASYKPMPDGHSTVHLGGLKLDFSSNFDSPEVDRTLSKAGIDNPSSLQREMFSRDFTCNTLLATLDLKRILDPTTMGVKDIRRKLLRTPLPPYITLGDDPKRIPRIIYMAAKLGFEVEPAIIRWVRKHPEAVRIPKEQYTRDKLSQAAKYDINKTAKLLTEMGLWKRVLLPDSLVPYAARNM